MTELQQVFLFYTFIYFLAKGALCIAIYIATIIVERIARQKHAMLQAYLKTKRSEEKERWKVAYEKCSRRYQPTNLPLSRAS